jgi:hypothetical protein
MAYVVQNEKIWGNNVKIRAQNNASHVMNRGRSDIRQAKHLHHGSLPV